MKLHIITLFPESFSSYFSASIMGRAIEQGHVSPKFYTLSDFAENNFHKVDDKAYGMHGQVISPEPLSKAIEHVFQEIWTRVPVLYMSPRWELLTQQKVEQDFATIQECIILCGHYEWIDERIIEYYDVRMISIWEYVISSGELAAMVYIDALVRHIPWVLWNPQSLEEESFSEKLHRQKEYPVYTRPEKFLWLEVPQILLSGHHKNIENWKYKNLS